MSGTSGFAVLLADLLSEVGVDDVSPEGGDGQFGAGWAA